MDGSGHFFGPLCAQRAARWEALVTAYPSDGPGDYAALTDFVRTQLPVDRPYFLLGESFSGPVAIALAAERPPMLRGLILSCTFARNPAPSMRVLQPLVRFAPLSHHWSALAAPFLLGWRAPAALRATLRAALATASTAALRQRLHAVLWVDHSPLARRIAVPVLYLQAAQDRVVFPGSARHLASLLPDMTTVVLPGPHLLLQRTPGPAAEAIASFMEAHRE